MILVPLINFGSIIPSAGTCENHVFQLNLCTCFPEHKSNLLISEHLSLNQKKLQIIFIFKFELSIAVTKISRWFISICTAQKMVQNETNALISKSPTPSFYLSGSRRVC